MPLDKSKITELINNLELLDDISTDDIPDIDLYINQVTDFMENKLGHLKRTKNDKILTKTMVNNYTKAGILMTSKDKKYGKEHIIMLILIYYMKQILTIDDIHSLMSPVLNNINTDSDDIIPLQDIYSTFLEIKQAEFNNYCDVFADKFKSIRDKVSKLDSSNQEMAELFLSVIVLVAQADAQKRLAEKIIDEYFKKL